LLYILYFFATIPIVNSNLIKKSKLNNLFHHWIAGQLVTSDWLNHHGIYHQLSDVYVKHGWIERLTSGIFKRPNDTITWQSALYTLQTLKQLPVHVGGLSAIELRGHSHFIRNQTSIRLYGDVFRLPLWCYQLSFNNTKFIYTKSSPWKSGFSEAISEYSKDSFKIRVSSLERAIMEFLHGVPQHHTYEEAAYLTEGLNLLRPQVVQTLMEQCTSVKVKRLFLHLATACQHAWLSKINRSRIDLGKGIRQIEANGYLDTQHSICVPTEPFKDYYVKQDFL